MKGVQCYELFGGIALKNHTFSFLFSFQRVVSYHVGLSCNVIIIFISRILSCGLEIQYLLAN